MITERQKNILRLIIQEYTNTGVPIGSNTLMEKGIQSSSATIRNDMNSLEKSGLLQKTHSSSGRVPSLDGYRYYVEYLLEPMIVNQEDLNMIRCSFDEEFHEINDIIEQSAKTLSQLTNYTALSLGPDVKERKLTGFRMIPLNNRKLLAVIVTDKGNIESQVLTIPNSVSSEDLEKMTQIVNEKLIGQPLLNVYNKLRTEIPMILHRYFPSPDGLMALFDTMLGHAFEEKIFVSGGMNVLDFSMSQGVKEMKSVYSFIQNKDELTHLFSFEEQQKRPIEVRIGSDIGNTLLDNMSMVTAIYEVSGHGKGALALLGPTCMPYSKIYSLIDVFRHELAFKLGTYYHYLDQ